jgi:hypothetical protein
MEFFIKKGATLPVLKINVIKDGRSDYDRTMRYLEETDIFFSMVDTETGIPKFTSRPAGVMKKEQLNTNLQTEYYVYYQFTPNDTKKVARYKGQFLFRNETGYLTLPLNQHYQCQCSAQNTSLKQFLSIFPLPQHFRFKLLLNS